MTDLNGPVHNNTMESILKNLKTSITCPQCSDAFNDPRLSPCLHSFCRKCLEQLWSQHSSKRSFRCPVCETEETAPVENQEFEISESPSDFHLNRLLDLNTLKKLKDQPGECHNCNEVTFLETFCFDCDAYLCSACTKAHTQMTMKKKHRERKLREFRSADFERFYRRPIYCEHERKDLEGIEFYCPECNSYMCGLCNIIDEEYHTTSDIQEIADRSSVEISEKAAIVRGKFREIQTGIRNTENRMDEIDRCVAELKNEVNAKVANLVKVLNSHGEEMIQLLEDIRMKKKEKLLMQKRNFERLSSQTTSSLEFVDSLLGREFAAEVMMLRDRVISRLETLSDLIVDTRPVEGAALAYIPNPSLVSIQESASFGNIVTGKADPLSCFADGEGLRTAFVGEESCFVVTTRDLNGDECYSLADRVTVHATSNNGDVIEAKVKDTESGLYEASYVPKMEGLYSLSVKVGDQHIQESPFEVNIKPPVMLPCKSFGSVSGANGLYTQPHGLAISSTGDIAISDTQKHCVHLLSPDGVSKMDFGGDELSYPVGVAFDMTEKSIIVADRDNHRLLVYSIKTGKLIRKIGRKGSGDGQFDGPSGICVDGEGRIIVADWNNHRIQVFSSDGLFLFKFGDMVKNKLKHPRAVTFCNVRKRFVVSDTGNNVIKVFGPKGKFLYSIGKPGVKKGELYSPRGITVDRLDRIVVCDFDNHRVQFFRFDGICLNSFGSKGKSPGQFDRPMGVALLNDDQIVVSDWGNDRIQVFSTDPQMKVTLLHENNNMNN